MVLVTQARADLKADLPPGRALDNLFDGPCMRRTAELDIGAPHNACPLPPRGWNNWQCLPVADTSQLNAAVGLSLPLGPWALPRPTSRKNDNLHFLLTLSNRTYGLLHAGFTLRQCLPVADTSQLNLQDNCFVESPAWSLGSSKPYNEEK